MKRNLKKALSVVLAASLMATSSAFTVLAAGEEIPPESVSLMPADADAVTGGTATMENGSLTLTAGDADTAFTWEVNQDVDITLLTNLYFNIEQDVYKRQPTDDAPPPLPAWWRDTAGQSRRKNTFRDCR